MLDVTEWILGALVVALGGAAFAVGGQVIRDAWRSGFKGLPGPLPEPGPPAGVAGPAGTAAAADAAPRSRLPGRSNDDGH